MRSLWNRSRCTLALLASLLLGGAASAGWSIGVGFHTPIYPRPYYGGYYYRPAAVYVRPVVPIYAQPITVIQPVEVYQPVSPAPAVPPVDQLLPAPKPVTPAQFTSSSKADVERLILALQNPDEHERAESATQLGKLRSVRSLSVLVGTLNTDRSPLVRDAAARALGLIGSSDALPALQRAAQADDDRDVRRSASYAADIIRANLGGR